ncbi:Vault poly [Colletotrichum asianum]|uniref:von willebrand domain containing protein n=1 Tax=Colletotrichum asianum TaxID=702518 RepID=A0A8H3W5H5_9PEZI|nr:von willebrand domain containing protein [Colletotrichum asianum]
MVFGQHPLPGGLFGGLGSNANNNKGGLFGSSNSGNSNTGNTSNPFGNAPTTGGLFGSINNNGNIEYRDGTTGGLFGRSTGGSLFGGQVNNMAGHVCGLYYLDPTSPYHYGYRRNYLPSVSQSVHARVVASTARTTLTQTFVNPSKTEVIPELRYTFPLYDGVSVVGFTCTINNTRVIRGVVQEKNTARKTYAAAVAKGETAGLFEQLPEASDVFTTTIGNAPAGAELKVEIAYLGELKHDAEVDGIRLTIPTSIAPRYGSYPGTLMEKPPNVSSKDGIEIVVDAEIPDGSAIKSIQSPSHPIAVSVGSTSTMSADATPSLQLASATLSLGTAELERDFIIQIIATNTSNPIAVLETHPTKPHQQAIMATLVPKFKLATTKPEVVFVCDRSGSMQGKIADLKNALQIYMKSLPIGCMFNICSFGSRHTFLFPKSQTYDQNTLKTAMKHIDKFGSDYGGTELYAPIEQTFKRRHKDLDLEVFVLTDGEVWNHENLFGMVNKHVEGSKGSVRLFTLGIGRGVSHALVEGLARAGRGFSQTVSEKEKMSGKVVRMLKGALTPHVKDYSLEVKYADAESETEPEDDFEIIDPVSPKAEPSSERSAPEAQKPISLFDPDSEDVDMDNTNQQDDGTGTERFSHVPTVKPPKILQAPFRIPPLYPYSRTSVYLLLSPERAMRNRTPSSVVLRGTSSQGPLELEIPITILAEKAETIHQLAARKAVKELEEGRGWIFHAKGKDGKELQKSLPGRFPAMVEREAVRLGVGFQVGGKWCSFVAVEANEDDADAVESPVEEVPAPRREPGWQGIPDMAEDRRCRNTAPLARKSIMKGQSVGLAPQQAQQQAQQQQVQQQQAQQQQQQQIQPQQQQQQLPNHQQGLMMLRQDSSKRSQPLGMARGTPAPPSVGGSLFGAPSSPHPAPIATAFGSGVNDGVVTSPSNFEATSPVTSPVGSQFGCRSPSFGGDSPVYGGNSPSYSPVSQAAPAATTSVFGNQPTAGGLFGFPTSTPPGASSSAFGSQPTAGGLFGGSTSSAPGASSSLFGSKSTTGGLFGGPTSPAPNTTSSPFGNKPSTGGLFGSSSSSFSGAPRAFASNALARPAVQSAAPPSGGGLFGTSASTGGLFGAPAPAPVQAAALAPPIRQVDPFMLAQYQREMSDAAAMPLPDEDLIDYSDEDVDPKPAAPVHKRKRRSAGNSLFMVEAEVDEDDDAQVDEDGADKFSALVEMQDFSGFWAWSAQLLKVLDVTEQHVNDALASFQASQNVVATSVAVAFLRKKLAHESESWEMMEEKAVAWLEEEIGDDEVGKVLAAAEALF